MGRQHSIWLMEMDFSTRQLLTSALEGAGFATRLLADDAAQDEISGVARPDVIILGINGRRADELKRLSRLRAAYTSVPLIVIAVHASIESAVAVYRCGAFEYLPKPFAIDDAVALTQRAIAQAKGLRPVVVALPIGSDAEIIGESPAMQEVFRTVGRLAGSSINVLITGESGTGKELVARALHRYSPRADRPFVALNMAAIPRELMESELFGHERGAFTGALQQRIGRFEQADGGSLFLDEIGDMPLETQTRLLRVLADGEFYRVGGREAVRVDVRIIAATHQNLEQRVTVQTFRQDLYHRLNVIRIQLPSLVQRREDIPALLSHFLGRIGIELGIVPKLLLPETAAYLAGLEWPGNVRQLENTCRWLTVMAVGRELRIDDLPPELLTGDGGRAAAVAANREWQSSLRRWVHSELGAGRRNLHEAILPIVERIMIETALEHSSGNRGEAAVLLGWGRNTLPRKIKQFATLAR